MYSSIFNFDKMPMNNLNINTLCSTIPDISVMIKHQLNINNYFDIPISEPSRSG